MVLVVAVVVVAVVVISEQVFEIVLREPLKNEYLDGERSQQMRVAH